METNDLLILLEMYPHKDWDFQELSCNPNITWEFVKDHPRIKWDYQFLSANPNITWEIIKSNSNLQDRKWDYIIALSNPSLISCKEDINEYIGQYIPTASDQKTIREIGYYLSQNPNVTWDYVKQNPQIYWYYRYLAKNANIKWETIRDNPTLFNFASVELNPNITWEIVKSNSGGRKPRIDCYWQRLSANPNITWKIMRDNSELGWDYLSLFSHPNVDWKEMESMRSKLGLSYDQIPLFWQNPNITWKIANGNTERNSIFCRLSRNLFLKDRRSIRFKEEFRKCKETLELAIGQIVIMDLRNLIADYAW